MRMRRTGRTNGRWQVLAVIGAALGMGALTADCGTTVVRPKGDVYAVLGVGPECAARVTSVRFTVSTGDRIDYEHDFVIQDRTDLPVFAPFKIPASPGAAHEAMAAFSIGAAALGEEEAVENVTIVFPDETEGRLLLVLPCVCIGAECGDGKTCVEDPPGSGQTACVEPQVQCGDTGCGGEPDGGAGGSMTSVASSSSSGNPTTTGPSSSSQSSSSTGGDPPPPTCKCKAGLNNFCFYGVNAAGCPMTAPGGYCDPNGDGSFADGDWDKGYNEHQQACGGGPAPGSCPCSGQGGFNNFCMYGPNTPNCQMTAPGGYCDPNGDGSYNDGNWDQGFNEYAAACGGPPMPTCQCQPGKNNYCLYGVNQPGCPMTAPGGYCDPNGDGDFTDGDWNKGYFEENAACPG